MPWCWRVTGLRLATGGRSASAACTGCPSRATASARIAPNLPATAASPRPNGYVTERMSGGSCLGLDADPHGAAQTGAAEPAIAVCHLGQVLLVVVLGEIERRCIDDLGGDRPVAVGREHLL